MGAALSTIDFSGAKSEDKDLEEKDDRRRNSLAFYISQFVDFEEDDFGPLIANVQKDKNAKTGGKPPTIRNSSMDTSSLSIIAEYSDSRIKLCFYYTYRVQQDRGFSADGQPKRGAQPGSGELQDDQPQVRGPPPRQHAAAHGLPGGIRLYAAVHAQPRQPKRYGHERAGDRATQLPKPHPSDALLHSALRHGEQALVDVFYVVTYIAHVCGSDELSMMWRGVSSHEIQHSLTHFAFACDNSPVLRHEVRSGAGRQRPL